MYSLSSARTNLFNWVVERSFLPRSHLRSHAPSAFKLRVARSYTPVSVGRRWISSESYYGFEVRKIKPCPRHQISLCHSPQLHSIYREREETGITFWLSILSTKYHHADVVCVFTRRWNQSTCLQLGRNNIKVSSWRKLNWGKSRGTVLRARFAGKSTAWTGRQRQYLVLNLHPWTYFWNHLHKSERYELDAFKVQVGWHSNQVLVRLNSPIHFVTDN